MGNFETYSIGSHTQFVSTVNRAFF